MIITQSIGLVAEPAIYLPGGWSFLSGQLQGASPPTVQPVYVVIGEAISRNQMLAEKTSTSVEAVGSRTSVVIG